MEDMHAEELAVGLQSRRPAWAALASPLPEIAMDSKPPPPQLFHRWAPPEPLPFPAAAALPSFAFDAASDATTAFDSALSSLVSSPATTADNNVPSKVAVDDAALGDLIGRLGGICHSNNTASCYNTPLSSPPTHWFDTAMPTPEQLAKSSPRTTPASSNARKRKNSRAKAAKDGPSPSSASSAAKESTEANSSVKKEKEDGEDQSNVKPPEPPKDYIHVRARRGQATDSHSLAERVRRERISERMKLLQALVPGCDKVTGKAVMLDEIINYVQSLQRQVEFLSLKLATMYPQLDLSASALLPTDIHQPMPPVTQASIFPTEDMNTTFLFAREAAEHSAMFNGGGANQYYLGTAYHGFMEKLPTLDDLQNGGSQVGVLWDQEFHGAGHEVAAMANHSFYGQTPLSHIKNEH